MRPATRATRSVVRATLRGRRPTTRQREPGGQDRIQPSAATPGLADSTSGICAELQIARRGGFSATD